VAGGGEGVLGLEEEEEPPPLPLQPELPSAASSLAALAPAAAPSLVRREREQQQGRVLEPPWVIEAKAAAPEEGGKPGPGSGGGNVGKSLAAEGSQQHSSLPSHRAAQPNSQINITNPQGLTNPNADYEMVFENATCREDWIVGSDRSQSSLADCAALCRANSTCKYFAFSRINKDCAQFWDGCTKDTRWKTYVSYKMLNKRTFNPNHPRNCSWSMESCKHIAKKLGLQVGDDLGGTNFSKEYATKGCFTYAIGPYKGKVYYGTDKGSSIAQKPPSDNDPVYPVVRPVGYPFCEVNMTTPPPVVYPVQKMHDYSKADIYCGKFGAQTMGIDEPLRGCTSTGGNWTQISATVRGDACRVLCADHVVKSGNTLCCYSGAPHTTLGCWVKPDAKANVIGTGNATMCKKGLLGT